MYTFKPQAKSNAKRFLISTCKIDPVDVDQFLFLVDGQWGTYLAADGTPVNQLTKSYADKPADRATGYSFGNRIAAAAVHTAAPATAHATAAQADALSAGVGAPVPQTADQEVEPSEPATALGGFALAQLTGDAAAAANVPPPATPKTVREGVTSTVGLKIQKDRATQNGVTRPSEGSIGDVMWKQCDSVGPLCTLAQAREMALAAGYNGTSAAIGLYRWRRFNGYTGK